MIDGFGRKIDYIRISVTDRCNLRCRYCMPNGCISFIDKAEILSFEEILRLCKIFAKMGIEIIKITGGEPLVRNSLSELISQIKKIDGIRQVTMTTNGILLEKYINQLINAGLDAVNISVDTLDKSTFKKLTGYDAVSKLKSGIDAACEAGIPVKINCVPIKGINENELVSIAELAREKVSAVRFIELMPVGLGIIYQGLSAPEVQEILECGLGKLYISKEKLGNGPASYMNAQGFKGKLGFIHAISCHFCDECNRIRLTSEGQLKLCLAHDYGVDLKPLLRSNTPDDKIMEIIRRAVLNKPRQHDFGKTEVVKQMNAIGG